MPTLRLHIKTTEGGLIKEPSILLDYTQRLNWGPCQRMLKHRRIDRQDLASRHCTEEELKECTHPYRVGFLRYDDWQKLIEDERKWTEDADWFAKLAELKRQYPQFDHRKEDTP